MMGDFSNSEKADMCIMYSAANGINIAAIQLYQERFPNKRMSNHKMLEWLHQHLDEYCAFHACSTRRTRTRIVPHPNVEEPISNIVDETFHRNRIDFVKFLNVSLSTAYRVLQEKVSTHSMLSEHKLFK